VKLFATVSFSAVLILLSSIAFAQIDNYGVDVILDEDGRSLVKMSLIFDRPIKNFNFMIFARIESFRISPEDLVKCNLTVGEASSIDCISDFTPKNKTLEIYFETNDFVKVLDNRSYFNGDFTLSKNIDEFFISVRLSEGLVLPEEDIEKVIFPKTGTVTSDGRRVVIVWRDANVTADQSLKFQVAYEKAYGITEKTSLWWYILGGAIITIPTAFFIVYRIKKPKEVILSVLDDHERKIIEIISKVGGEINQKKIVQETNLSKAKVSRLVKGLVERGLIETQRRGRTSRLKLVKKKFKF
jgi:DNA-binding transcriptional ArsR family regulator